MISRSRVRGISEFRWLCLAFVLAGCHQAAPAVVDPPPMEVVVGTPDLRLVQEHLEFTGRTVPVDKVEIRARVSGYLKKPLFLDGQFVPVDEELFQIDTEQYQAVADRAKSEVERTDAMVAKSTSDLARAEKLLPKGAVSREEYDAAVAQKLVAEATLKSTQAQLRLADLDLKYTTIKAPIAGRASKSNFSVGHLVSPGSDAHGVLTTIVSVAPIRVEFDVDEPSLLRYKNQSPNAGRLQSGANVKDLKLPVYIRLANEQGWPHAGLLDFADNQLDPTTGTIRVRGEFANADHYLGPGLFVQVRIPMGEPRPRLLIPERAIGIDQGQKFVFVVDSKNQVEGRQVRLGLRFDDEREILAGLTSADRLIVSGIQWVRPGMTVAPKALPVKDKPAAPAASKSGDPPPVADPAPKCAMPWESPYSRACWGSRCSACS